MKPEENVNHFIPGYPSKPNNLMSTDGELKQWQRDLMNDPVNHPSHYTDGNIECIDYIEDKHLGFHLGNAVKYISRAGKKDPKKTIEDLEKARWYLDREIERLKKVQAESQPDNLKAQHASCCCTSAEDARIAYAQEHMGDLE